jgi:septum formation protein
LSRRLLLASASPRRPELLRELVDEFDVAATGVEEDEAGPVEQLAARLAAAKARAAMAQNPGRVVLAADTVVALGARSFGKPGSADEVVAMWRELGGREHRVMTAVAVGVGAEVRVEVSTSTVRLGELDEAAVRRYAASGRPMDKAGGYAIQDDDVPTVAALDGCYCGVMGLPLWLTHRMLRGLVAPLRAPSLSCCLQCPERQQGSVAYGVEPWATSE